MEMTYQLNDFLIIFKKKLKHLIIIPLLFACCGLIISYFFISPLYESRVDLLINYPLTNTEEQLTTMDIETNLRLIETYQFIIKSDYIIDIVSQELGHTYSNEELKNNLHIEASSDSQIVSLFVRNNNLEKSVEIVNLIAITIQKEVKTLMNIENIQILTTATKDKFKEPIFPKPIFLTILSFTIGVLSVVIYTLLSYYFRTKVSTKEDVEKFLGLPLIGKINTFQTKSKKYHLEDIRDLSFILKSRTIPRNEPTVEAYRTLRTNLQFQARVNSLKTILVTSTSKNEGKTTTSRNLAAIMALDNKKTVLIDADLRKEKPEIGFGRIGLTNYLAGHNSLEDILIETSTPNLKLIASGPLPPTPSELLSSKHMDEMLDELKSQFDQIIIDSPPLFLSDASILATKVDGCMLVIQADKTKVTHVRQAIDQLKNVHATILGTVLNKAKLEKKTLENYNYGTRWKKNEARVSEESTFN